MGIRFSKRAESALREAKEVAKEAGALHPGSLHILLGILSEERAGAWALLRRAEADIASLQSACELEVSKGNEDTDSEHEWREILKEAACEAQNLGAETVGTVHLLLGLLRHGKNRAALVLSNFGLEINKLRSLAQKYLPKNKQTQRTDPPRPALQAAAFDLELAFASNSGARARPEVEEKVLSCIASSFSCKAVLYGVKGAGKRSLVRSLSQRLRRDGLGLFSQPMKPLALSLTRLVGWRWQRAQQKVGEFINDISRPGSYILVVHEIDVYPGSPYEGDARFFLRILAENAAFPVLFLCLPSTYELLFKDDLVLSNTVDPIEVPPPCGREAMEILYYVREKLENHHGVVITEETVEQAFALASKIFGNEAFPITCRVLDHACASFRMTQALKVQKECAYLEEKLSEVIRKKQSAVKRQDYHEAAQLRDEENRIREEIATRKLQDFGEEGQILDPTLVLSLLESLSKSPASFQLQEK